MVSLGYLRTVRKVADGKNASVACYLSKASPHRQTLFMTSDWAQQFGTPSCATSAQERCRTGKTPAEGVPLPKLCHAQGTPTIDSDTSISGKTWKSRLEGHFRAAPWPSQTCGPISDKWSTNLSCAMDHFDSQHWGYHLEVSKP